jgi:hypothetical protein
MPCGESYFIFCSIVAGDVLKMTERYYGMEQIATGLGRALRNTDHRTSKRKPKILNAELGRELWQARPNFQS